MKKIIILLLLSLVYISSSAFAETVEYLDYNDVADAKRNGCEREMVGDRDCKEGVEGCSAGDVYTWKCKRKIIVDSFDPEFSIVVHQSIFDNWKIGDHDFDLIELVEESFFHPYIREIMEMRRKRIEMAGWYSRWFYRWLDGGEETIEPRNGAVGRRKFTFRVKTEAFTVPNSHIANVAVFHVNAWFRYGGEYVNYICDYSIYIR